MSTPYRTCPQCGTPQAPGLIYCSNCGARLPDTSSGGVPPTELATPAQNPYGQSSNPSNQNPYEQSSNPYNTPQYGSGHTDYGNQSYAPPPPVYSNPYQPNNPYTPPQQQGGGYYPPQFPQAPQPQNRPKTGLIIGGIVLVLVIIIGGVLIYSSSHSNNTVTQTTPTATQGTATVGVTPTAQALFSDNFADNSKNWDLQSASGYGASISNNELTMKEANKRIFQEPVPADVPNDFAVTTTFTILQGDLNDSVGVEFRSSKDGAIGYVVEVYGDGAYDIVKIGPDPSDSNKLKFSTIVDVTTSDAIHAKGTQNTMNVAMKGSTMVVQFNGQTVKTVSDSSLSSGSMELFLSNGNTSDGVQAAFSNIAIYQAPAQ